MKQLWNKIITGVAIVSVVASMSFMYLYNHQKNINEDLRTRNNRYEREVTFVKSINFTLSNINADLVKANSDFIKRDAEITWKLKKIEEKYKAALAQLEGMSIDSVAQYIVDNFLGNTYKVQRINDSTFIAFQEITVRDIANANEAFKAQNERFEQLSIKVGSQDTLIKLQAKNISILTNTADTLLARFNTINTDFSKCEKNVLDLTNEVDKQKGLKRIGFLTSGGLLLVLLILI